MEWFTNSVFGAVAIVVFLIGGATIGIGIIATLASAVLQFAMDQFGDRDTELLEAAEGES